MNKKLSLTIISLCALLFTFLFTPTFGQLKDTPYASIEAGEVYTTKTSSVISLMACDNESFYTLRLERKSKLDAGYYLELHNKNLQQVKSVKLELTKNHTINRFRHYKGNLHLFTELLDKDSKDKLLFVQKIDKQSFKLIETPKQIAKIAYDKRRDTGTFDLSVARDSSKILVYYKLPYEKGEKEKFGFHVFDADMNLMWTKDIVLPYEDKRFQVKDYQVDNRGNIYLLSVLYEGSMSIFKADEINYVYKILSYTENGKKAEEYNVEVEGKYLNQMKIAIVENNDLVCVGFYSEKSALIIGSYFLRIDNETKKIKIKNFKEFGLDFITQDMTEKEKKKTQKKAAKGKNVGLFQYDLRNIIITNEGGVILVAEQYYMQVVTTSNRDSKGRVISKTTNYYYNYHDIIIINTLPNGEIEWTQKIPKRQYSVNDSGYYSSYGLVISNNKLHFLFNDHPRNIYDKSLKEGKIYSYNRKEAVLALHTVTLDNKENKSKIAEVQKKSHFFRPKVSYQSGENEMIIFAENKKGYRFYKITLK